MNLSFEKTGVVYFNKHIENIMCNDIISPLCTVITKCVMDINIPKTKYILVEVLRGNDDRTLIYNYSIMELHDILRLESLIDKDNIIDNLSTALASYNSINSSVFTDNPFGELKPQETIGFIYVSENKSFIKFWKKTPGTYDCIVSHLPNQKWKECSYSECKKKFVIRDPRMCEPYADQYCSVFCNKKESRERKRR